MSSPKTVQQLADAIESLVASYMDEVRCVARQAVDRSLSGSSVSARTVKTKPVRNERSASARKRRSGVELGELRERLYALVCARPGEAMAVFADEIGVPVRALERPMSRLKAEGRVRSVGQRNQMHYFPAIGRRPKNEA